MFGMDPVLSGSLCFLILAIAMYLKFIREQPWSDEEMVDHKSDHKRSPVDDGDDAMPFLHPSSPAGRLQAQQQQKPSRQQVQQVQQPQPHHGYAGLQKTQLFKLKPSRQTSASAVVAAEEEARGGGTSAAQLPQKQPMRRRTHSASAMATGAHNGKNRGSAVAAAAETSDLGVDMDILPTTIYEDGDYGQFRPRPQQQVQPPSSGRNQHRITFDDYDEEMGFLSSPPRHVNAADESLDSVPFEDDSDGFYDLESNHQVTIGDSPEHPSVTPTPPLVVGDQYRGGDLLDAEMEASCEAKTLKSGIERQFVRNDVAPPAQMQLEVARKARIPLFLHSPMYVKTSAAALVDEVDAEFQADEALANAAAAAGGGNVESPAVAVAAGQEAQAAVGVGAAVAVAPRDPMRRRRPKLSKAKNESLHVDFKELQIAEMIGQGAFGTVHRASWRGTSVAVKILVCQYLTVDILEEFEAEVQIMSILRHPNICMLLAACLEPPTRCLVIEYLPRGSLWNVLRQDVVIDLPKQTSFARDTALGMNYLHSFQPPILHRDLKSPNLLIDSSYALKISDFGLARVRAHFQTMTGNCGTTQWMAPEVLAAEKYTEKADVFSYGVVIWETITRQCPYDGLTQIQAALGVLNNNLRPTIPENCPPLFKKLMTLCWVSTPEDRPTFETVLEILHSSTDGCLPPEPERALSDSHLG